MGSRDQGGSGWDGLAGGESHKQDLALAGPAPGFQALLSLLRRNDWDVVMRVWAVASDPSPPSRLQRRLAVTALAHLSGMAELQHALAQARVLAK